jgi:WD40 repeat protein
VSLDGDAAVWDTASGAPIISFKSHYDRVNSISFSPDGSKIATSSHDQTTRVFNLKGECLCTLNQTYPVNTSTFSPDGTKLLTASDDGTARVWDAAVGNPIAPVMGHGNVVNSAFFNSDGQWIITASWSGAKIWDVKSGLEMNMLMEDGNRVEKAMFSSDSSHVLTLSEEGRATVWFIAADEDQPPDLCELEGQIWNGLFINNSDKPLPMEHRIYVEKYNQWIEKASAHARECRYPHANTWLYIHHL